VELSHLESPNAPDRKQFREFHTETAD